MNDLVSTIAIRAHTCWSCCCSPWFMDTFLLSPFTHMVYKNNRCTSLFNQLPDLIHLSISFCIIVFFLSSKGFIYGIYYDKIKTIFLCDFNKSIQILVAGEINRVKCQVFWTISRRG